MTEIHIGSKTKEAMKILEIDQFPFSESALKTSYKRLIFRYHPDRNGEDERCLSKTKEIIEAYNHIKNLAAPEPTEDEAAIIRKQFNKEKEDIFTFWRPCKNCKSTGRVITEESRGKKTEYHAKICPACKGACEIRLEIFNPVIPKGAIMI